jgi:hypothetical protein
MAAARVRDDVDAPAGSSLNAYTGMVVISLVATIIGLVFLLLDWSSYKDAPPPPVPVQAKTAPAKTAAQPPTQVPAPPAAQPKAPTPPKL